jgi:hypothetical protein
MSAPWFAAGLALALLVLAGIGGILSSLIRRRVFDWLPSYVRGLVARRPRHDGPVHVMFCFVDHFEPRWGRADYATERERVRRWCEGYPRLCAGHVDADGKPPRHTFFFPEEEYRPEHMRDLVDLCRAGYGEIEIHLHHDRDTSSGLRTKLRSFTRTLVEELGALPIDPRTGRAAWAFVHGNWALDNSRPDGRWCGVDDELTVLSEEGCYADFTLPSAPDSTQTRTINSIYYATDDPRRPKSHDYGTPVAVGGVPVGHLMIVQGPLGLNWRWRKYGFMPRIENADVRKSSPPRPDRTDLWIRTGIHVQGRPEWTFVKVHTHGTQEHDMDTILGPATDALFRDLERRYNDGVRYVLHYVTAREMYNIIKAAEAGRRGDPGQYRDFVVPPPTFTPTELPRG